MVVFDQTENIYIVIKVYWAKGNVHSIFRDFQFRRHCLNVARGLSMAHCEYQKWIEQEKNKQNCQIWGL